LRVVFGIGNPGAGYEGTRHNLGFDVVDALAAGASFASRPGPAAAASAGVDGVPLLLVKPLTYVNRCGPVLAAIRDELGAPLDHLLVVVDDLDLPLGTLRLRPRGSDGGHNGLRSILASLEAEDVPRLRIGIGGPGEVPAERYVLEPFPPSERTVARAAVARAADAVRLWAREGIERAMAEVNRRDLDRPAGAP